MLIERFPFLLIQTILLCYSYEFKSNTVYFILQILLFRLHDNYTPDLSKIVRISKLYGNILTR